nr:reverse transcriptase domain-containing protein [Tanacetum cinerariifolium]
MLSVAPPSPDYIPGPEEPQIPPAPQDEDEHEPMFIQPHDPDFVLEPIYPEYIPLEDEHILSAEEQPLPPVVSPSAESPGYVAESDPKEDPEEYEDDETEDGPVDYPMYGGDDGDDDDDDSSGDDTDDENEDEEEEEEHLAPADSAVVIPIDEFVAPPEGTKPDAISFPPEAEVERLLAMPTPSPSPSPLTSLSPPSAGERLARCTAPAALPSSPLPPPLYMPPPVNRRDDIPETEMPPRKSTLDAEARQQGIREVGYGIRDTWIDPVETIPEIAPMTVGEVNPRVTELVELHEHDTRDLYALLEDAQDSRTCISQRVTVDSQRVDLLLEDRIAHQETIQIMEYEAYAVREAWAHSIRLSQAVHSELQTHQEQVGCAVENQVKFATCTLLDAALIWWNSQIRSLGPDAYSMTWEVLKKKMTDKYCPLGGIKKLEIELWNLKVKENNVLAYTESFQELTLICTKFVANETEKIEKYVSGLPDNIYGSMKASKPKTLDETIELANDLMDQKLHTYVERQSNNKRKADESFRNNHSHQQQTPKRQNVTRVYNIGTGEKKPYSGNLPKNTGANPKGNGCFECGSTGHFKRDCPKLKNKDEEKVNVLGWVYAVRNAEKRGNASRDPDSNVVMGTFLLNNRYASILFDTGADRSFISTAFSSLIDIIPTLLGNSYDVELEDGKIVRVDTIIRDCTLNFLGHPFNIDLMPLELGSFDVIIGMDWLRRFHAVCDEKLVRIPYGNETLTFRATKISAKKEEDKSEGKQLEDVPVVRDYPKVFPKDLPGLPLAPHPMKHYMVENVDHRCAGPKLEKPNCWPGTDSRDNEKDHDTQMEADRIQHLWIIYDLEYHLFELIYGSFYLLNSAEASALLGERSGEAFYCSGFIEQQTRYFSRLTRDQSSNPTSSTNNTPKGRNRRSSKQRVESSNLEEHLPPVVTMADNRTMAELLRPPTEGYAEAIVVPSILAEKFDLKHSLINMMTTDQFFRLEKDNSHDHIRWFNKITSTIKYRDVPNSVIKLILFPFSLTGAARWWLEKEPPRSITTWEDLLSKFINEFFLPSRTTNLRNEISNFQQRFDKFFHEAWDRYKDLVRACPHHGFTELHQLDTFYNALNPADQDSLNAAAGGNLLERINQQTSAVTTAMTTMLKQFQATPPPAPVKAVEEIWVTCGGAHTYYQYLAAGGNIFPELRDNIQGYVSAAAVNYNQSNPGSGSLPSNTVANPKGELKSITTRSGLVTDGPTIPTPPKSSTPEVDERVDETFTDPDLAEYTIKVPPPPVQKYKPPSQREFVMHKRDPLHPNISYPSRMLKQKQQEKDEKMLKALLSNKEKLQELANRPLNKNCSAVILKKLPKKLRDLGKFLIPCGFSELKCKALADLADFVIVDYESDPRVPFILGRPFLRTARALIDVHGEEMILRDGDERLTLNMRHDTSSYSNQPQKESINLINIFNFSSEDFLEVRFSNQPSGNPTFSPHQELTSLEITNDIFDSEGCNVLSKKLSDLNYTKDLHPPLHDNLLSGCTTYFSNLLLEEFADELPSEYDDNLQFDIDSDLKEIEFLLYQDKYSSLKDSIDQKGLANLDAIFIDPIPKMFTDEHTLDYLSPLKFDVYDDDFLEVESDTGNVYDDPFDSKEEKIKESKLLIDELDPPCDFLPPSEYESFISQDFSRVDALPSTNNEDKKKDNKEMNKIKTKPDKIESKQKAWKSPDSSPTKSKTSQRQESIKPRWENDPGKLFTAPDSFSSYADEPLVMSLEGIHVDDRLQFVEEPVEIIEREIKRLKRSRIPLVKVRWNSRRGPEFT